MFDKTDYLDLPTIDYTELAVQNRRHPIGNADESATTNIRHEEDDLLPLPTLDYRAMANLPRFA